MNQYYYQVRRDGVDEDIREMVEIHTGNDVTEEDVMFAVSEAEDDLRPDADKVLTYNGYVRALFDRVCSTIESEMECRWNYVGVIGTLTI